MKGDRGSKLTALGPYVPENNCEVIRSVPTPKLRSRILRGILVDLTYNPTVSSQAIRGTASNVLLVHMQFITTLESISMTYPHIIMTCLFG